MSSFLQGLEQFGQMIVSGAEAIGSALESAFSSAVNDFQNFFGSFWQGLQNLPSDISNFFQSIAGAIVTFAKVFGTYIWDGLQMIASGLSQMMVPIANAITWLQIIWMDTLLAVQYDLKSFASDVVNFFTSTVGNVISGVQNFFNDMKNVFINAYNFILTISSDIYYMVNTIVNFFFNMPNFFTNISEYLNELLQDPGNHPNLLTMIPHIITSEATRIAKAFPDVIGFNTFMELFPRIVNGIASYPVYSGDFRGILGKAMLLVASPFLSALISMMTEAVMQSIFSSTQTTQTAPRPSHPQIKPVPNAPSAQLPPRSTSTATVSDLQVPQFSTLTVKKIETQLKRPTTTGVFIEDVIGMGTPNGGSIEMVSGYVIFQSVSQEFQDTFEITPTFAMQSTKPPYYILSQGMGVSVSLTLINTEPGRQRNETSQDMVIDISLILMKTEPGTQQYSLSQGMGVNMSVTLTQTTPSTQKYSLSQGMGVNMSVTLTQTTPSTQKYSLSQGMGVSTSLTLSQTTPSTQKYSLSQGMGVNMSIMMSGSSSPPPPQSQKYSLSQGMGVSMSIMMSGSSSGGSSGGTPPSQPPPSPQSQKYSLSQGMGVAISVTLSQT